MQHGHPKWEPGLAGIYLALQMFSGTRRHIEREWQMSKLTDLQYVESSPRAEERTVGLTPGERVVAHLGNRTEAVAILTACLAAGAIFVPLNPAYTAAEMDAYCDLGRGSRVKVDLEILCARAGRTSVLRWAKQRRRILIAQLGLAAPAGVYPPRPHSSTAVPPQTTHKHRGAGTCKYKWKTHAALSPLGCGLPAAQRAGSYFPAISPTSREHELLAYLWLVIRRPHKVSSNTVCSCATH
jgi:AMP-binding enzyme